MSAKTPAGKLASLFGHVDQMRALYAPRVEWHISASLGVPAMIGIDAVAAFNRQVWTEHHRGDCIVTILDELGDESRSATRFRYRAWSLLVEDWYDNEYSLFVHAGTAGITRVHEAFDTSAAVDFYTRRPAGASWGMIDGTVAAGVATLGRGVH